MLKLFTPKSYVKKYNAIALDTLHEKGIKLIICDVDNTLVPHDEKYPDQTAEEFVRNVQSEGFQFCLISNNFSERVDAFAHKLNVHTYSMAKKPLKVTYKKIMKDYGLSGKQIASIGDQLLTDVLGGNRAGIYTILSKPLVERDLKATKINRVIENKVFKLLEKKGILTKGEFNE